MKQKILLSINILLCVAGAAALQAPVQAFADDGKDGGTLTCATQNNQIWDIEGSFTQADLAPTVTLYQGGTFIQHFTTSASNVKVSVQVSAQTTNQVYSLHNGTSASDAVLIEATCSAKTVSAAPAAATPATPSTTTTAAVTNSSSGQLTTTPSASADTTAPAATDDTFNDPAFNDPTFNNIEPTHSSGFFKVLVPIYLVGAIVFIVGLWFTFRKAGRPGWAAIVPIYNAWVVFELGGYPGWWALLMFVPFVNLVALAIFVLASFEIANRFGKSKLFGFFGLCVFGLIGWCLLGFGKAQYSAPKNAALDHPTTVPQA